MAVFELLGGICSIFCLFRKVGPCVRVNRTYSVEDHAVLSFLGAYIAWQLCAGGYVLVHVTILTVFKLWLPVPHLLFLSSIYILLL
jgi:hypothetical protein